MKKGEHIGHFAYGGSSHVMVFQNEAHLVFNQKLYDNAEGLREGRIQRLSSYLCHAN